MMESTSPGAFQFREFLMVLRAVGPLLAYATAVWLRAKYARKVTLKSKDITVEASSVEEVEKLFKVARRP
jgi:hypothetical protein